EAIRRFRREIQAAAQLSHPNIVRAFDANQAGAIHFFAMEYVEGIDLLRLVQQRGQLAVAEACDYVRQAALGLQHALECGLVHRDTKPSNLMVVSPASSGSSQQPRTFSSFSTAPAQATLKILDMGLARLTASGASLETQGLTQPGVPMGTADYIAPEQSRDSHGADIRADIYSLGCTFYYLLAEEVPFPGG